jgi:ELWxxDGT repeat protein
MIEPKGIFYPGTLSDEPICDPPEHTVCHYDELDAEIRSVLAPPAGTDLLITPDEVRGARTTLREAVLQDGWPTPRQTRGRFLVAMLDSSTDRAGYTAEHPTLEGRAMFVNSTPDLDYAAVPGGIAFSAWAPEFGRELWFADAQGDSVERSSDVARGQESSSPRSIRASRGKIFAVADDGRIGPEIYAVAPEPGAAAPAVAMLAALMLCARLRFGFLDPPSAARPPPSSSRVEGSGVE